MEKKTKRIAELEKQINEKKEDLRVLTKQQGDLMELELISDAGKRAKAEELNKISMAKERFGKELEKLEERLELAAVDMAAGTDTDFVVENARNHGRDIPSCGG